MGSAYYRQKEGKERVLGQIIKEEYKFIVEIVGVKDETGEYAKGAYQLFKKIDDAEIRKYAEDVAKENNVRLTKVNVFSLELKLAKEISF